MKPKHKYIIAVVFGVLFLGFIVLLRTVDVDAIGPEGTKVGFAGLNGAVAKTFGYNEVWYRLTQLLGYASLALAGGVAIVGLVQLIQRKSLLKVDINLLFTGGLYIIVLIIYVLFSKIAVNYRPVILPDEGKLEPSFPSSHTMLACVVMGSVILLIPKYVKSVTVKWAAVTVLALAMMLTVVGRLLSGAHWLTDIAGGVMISICLLSLYSAIMDQYGPNNSME